MMLKKRAIFIGLVFLLCADVHIYATTPVYFHESTYTTLDQLDQALVEGEISYDDYLLLMESFLGSPDDDILTDETIKLRSADTVAAIKGGKSRLRLSYHGSLQQKIEKEPAFVRYDRLACEWGKLRLDLSFELRNQKQLLFRSRSLRYKHSGGEVIAGSYNLRLGQGVTQGLGSYHTELHEDNDFGSSLRLPIKNRHNGILIRQHFGAIQTGLLLSDIEGADFYRTAIGSFIEIGQSKRSSAGVIFLRQQLGRNGDTEQHQKYFAPYFRLSARTLTLSGESSFGLGSSGAHVYQAEIERDRARQDFTFFNYARRYQNLQSGGYAYSDYEELSIDGIDFSYRDKRAGRVGLATSSTLGIVDNVDIEVSFVRWNNRLDNRHCSAAKASLSMDKFAGTRNRIIARAIWENFDLTADSSSRRLVSLSTQSPISRSIEVESQWKFERRVRSGAPTSPFSVRADLLWRVLHDLAATVTLKYYSPDLGRSSSDYFHFAVGQKLTRLKAFSIWVKAQTKYLFDRQRLDVWEARVNCDFAT
jgi:hypothetical protein